MDNYYIYEGQKIPLKVSEQHQALKIQTPAEFQPASGVNDLNNFKSSTGANLLEDNIYLFPKSSERNLRAAFSLVANENDQIPVYEGEQQALLIPKNEIAIKFPATSSETDRKQLIAKYDLQVRKSDTDTGIVFATTSNHSKVITTANNIAENENVVFAQPNFIRVFSPGRQSMDPLFDRQWSLKNTGQELGVVGADINITQAWKITKGSAEIVVAVIDEGVDYSHEDLKVDLSTPKGLVPKLVEGYDAVLDRPGADPANDDYHGTACAGIIGAAGNNDLGICGVAPGCRILGIRIAQHGIGGWQTTDEIIYNGIMEAVRRGADILNNSWGGGPPSNIITEALRHARNHGRNEKGCVICCAAGNFQTNVQYPAYLPEVLAIAASNQWDQVKKSDSSDGEKDWGSNYGPEIFVAAPGVKIPTTDLSGSRGKSSGEYVLGFRGTSAAAPHVSGIAALILSVNPNLTAGEVEEILKDSADLIGQPGRNTESGYGRINAGKAVAATLSSLQPVVA